MSIKIVCFADISDPEKFYDFLCSGFYNNEKEKCEDLIFRIMNDNSFKEKIYIILRKNKPIGGLSLLYLDKDWANKYNDTCPWRFGLFSKNEMKYLRLKFKKIQEKHNIINFRLDL